MKKFSVLLIVLAGIILIKCLNPAASVNTPLTPATSLTMVQVPAGTFQRDSIAGNTSTVATFRISDKEITRSQFATVTGLADPSNPSYSASTNAPVQNVSWYHALVFCNKLSMADGRTPVYSIKVANVPKTDPADWGTIPSAYDTTWQAVAIDNAANGYRLPTENEWMWAAMGATGTYSKAFAGSTGSNSIANYAWTNENTSALGKSQPVGGKTYNELKIYDMSGNVWEWCWDRYVGYTAGAQDSSYRGPATGNDHAVRGGSWTDVAGSATVANRFSYDTPFFKNYNIGFRVVCP